MTPIDGVSATCCTLISVSKGREVEDGPHISALQVDGKNGSNLNMNKKRPHVREIHKNLV